MRHLINRLETVMALRNVKRNQHYIDMDGFKVYYEGIGSKQK